MNSYYTDTYFLFDIGPFFLFIFLFIHIFLYYVLWVPIQRFNKDKYVSMLVLLLKYVSTADLLVTKQNTHPAKQQT